MKNKPKNQLIALSITLVIVIALGMFILPRRAANANNGYLFVRVLPSDAAITVNGQAVSPNQKVTLSKGPKTVSVEKTGYMGAKFAVTISPGQEARLSANLQLNEKYVSSGGKINLPPSDIKAQGGLASGSYGQQGLTIAQEDELVQQSVAKTPILAMLPYYSDSFNIGAGDSQKYPNSSQQAVYIQTDTAAGKQAALQWLKDNGADPNSLEIVYVSS